ncbi:MAG: Ig-like domain-containing protein [Mogibacterium sp.]|nr:Ig-like domain-containing protein [Mogibacterium sp.]
MKKRGLIAVLAAIMVMASSVFCFADEEGLKLLSSYPEDGQTNTSIENVGVKLYFNHTFKNADVQKANKDLVYIVDSKGKKIDTKVLFSDKEDGMVLVVADNTKKAAKISNSEKYMLVVDAEFTDDDGHKLGERATVTFKTYNQKFNNIVNVVMMAVMFGGIMILTVKQQKDQQEEEKAAKQKTDKDNSFNPYKEAKKTGKSVDEVIAEEEARRAKLDKKRKRKKKDAPIEKNVKIVHCSDYLNNVYHVHAPNPVNKKKKAEAKKEAPAKNTKKGKKK